MKPTETSPRPATPTRRLLMLGAGLTGAAGLAACTPRPRDPNAPPLVPAKPPAEVDNDAIPATLPRRP